jgi:hypothetical protein
MSDLSSIGLLANLIAVPIAVFGLVLSILAYRAGKPIKEPLWSVTHIPAVAQAFSADDIGITYHGKPVRDLVASYVFFWNNGNAVVRREDWLPGEPVQVVINKETQVLEATIYRVTSPADSFNMQFDAQQNVCHIDFDFINPHSGLIIRILHMGGQPDGITVQGKAVPQAGLRYVDDLTRLLPKSLVIPEVVPA